MSTSTMIRAPAIQNIGLRRRARKASAVSDRVASWSASPTRTSARLSAPTASSGSVSVVCLSVMADPRVEGTVEQVDDEVHHEVDEHEDGHRTDDGDPVPVAEAGEDVATHAVDAEEALGDDRATEQGTEVVAEEGDDRDEGVAQRVDTDYP